MDILSTLTADSYFNLIKCVLIAALRHRDDPLLFRYHRHRHGAWRSRHPRLDHRRRLLARRRPWHDHHLLDGLAQPFQERQACGLCAISPFNIIGVCITVPLFFVSIEVLALGDAVRSAAIRAIPVTVDGKETFPLVPVAVGLFSTFFNVFNTLMLLPFHRRVRARAVACRPHRRRRHRGLLDPAIPRPQAGRRLRKSDSGRAAGNRPSFAGRALLFLDIARSAKAAPSDPGEHYLATDILSRDIRSLHRVADEGRPSLRAARPCRQPD